RRGSRWQIVFVQSLEFVDQCTSGNAKLSGRVSAVSTALGQSLHDSLLLRLGETGKVAFVKRGSFRYLRSSGLKNANNLRINKKLHLAGAGSVEHILVAFMAILLGMDRGNPTVTKINYEWFHVRERRLIDDGFCIVQAIHIISETQISISLQPA